MKGSELKKLLKKQGCYLVGQYNGHEKWYSPLTEKCFPIPRHDSKDIKPKTAENILKAAGLK